MSNTTATGAAYEQLAANYLRAQGLRLIEQNYRSMRGEIDLIFRDQSSLVFVEVKYRQHAYFGSAVAQVTHSKILKLRRCAEHYLLHKQLQLPCRFDVIGISQDRHGNPTFDWIQNAF